MRHPIIALMTDFGTEDGYVGAMKGRILSELPDAVIVDISHEIKPYDVRQGAFCLNNSYPNFPDKTVFVAVVDPGVGTERKGIVVKTSQHYFVGPDNGIFSFVLHREGYQASEIMLKAFNEEVSHTFHGRDVFARIAAWIVSGRDIKKFLNPLKEVYSFLKPPHKNRENEFILEIIHLDHFGNMILNFQKSDLLGFEDLSGVSLKIQELEIRRIHDTFGMVPRGELLLCWDSSGFLQIAQNMGSAAEKINCTVGDQVRLVI